MMNRSALRVKMDRALARACGLSGKAVPVGKARSIAKVRFSPRVPPGGLNMKALCGRSSPAGKARRRRASSKHGEYCQPENAVPRRKTVYWREPGGLAKNLAALKNPRRLAARSRLAQARAPAFRAQVAAAKRFSTGC